MLDNLFETPADAVANFGAIQSQDYNMAVWALGLRIKNPKRALIENAINTGEIIRTHILRPTWHFVHQKDIRWMMELSASNVKKATQYVDKKEGLTNELFNKIWRIIELEFNKTENLTKENIKNCLFQRKIEVNNLIEAPAVLIGTPGRVVYHLRNNNFVCVAKLLGTKMQNEFHFNIICFYLL